MPRSGSIHSCSFCFGTKMVQVRGKGMPPCPDFMPLCHFAACGAAEGIKKHGLSPCFGYRTLRRSAPREAGCLPVLGRTDTAVFAEKTVEHFERSKSTAERNSFHGQFGMVVQQSSGFLQPNRLDIFRRCFPGDCFNRLREFVFSFLKRPFMYVPVAYVHKMHDGRCKSQVCFFLNIFYL